MNIGQTGGVDGVSPIRPIRDAQRVEKATAGDRAERGDRAEISEEARLLAKLTALPGIREEKVAEMRKLIAEGAFETEERLRGAVDRIVDESL